MKILKIVSSWGGVNQPIWYMDEEICSCYRKRAVIEHLELKNGHAPLWIKRQKKLKKKGKYRDYFFNYSMLMSKRNIQYNTKGINPDYLAEPQIKRFMKGEEL